MENRPAWSPYQSVLEIYQLRHLENRVFASGTIRFVDNCGADWVGGFQVRFLLLFVFCPIVSVWLTGSA